MRVNTRVPVLDHGYVELVGHYGDDLRVANAAKASFRRRSETLGPKELGLIDYLAEHGHTTPFRHNLVTLEVCAPLMVARQIQRYVIGGQHTDTMGAWSEASYRYVTRGLEFYIPQAGAWRKQAEDRKQGSDGVFPELQGQEWTQALEELVDDAMVIYNAAIRNGMAGEQARLFLPAFGLYTTWWMTISLQSICWLFHERMKPDAMLETRDYAIAMYSLVQSLYPNAIRALMENLYQTNLKDLEEDNGLVE